jgi:hypothetical protein
VWRPRPPDTDQGGPRDHGHGDGRYHVADDAVIVEFDLLGTNLGEFYGMPPTGNAFRVPGMSGVPPDPAGRPRNRIAATVDGMRIALIVVGVIVTLFGLLFALQGFGAVAGSPMSNTTTWSVLGPLIALVGIVIAVIGWRMHKS